jgi:tRNA(fMet)-specific endonuclease VapC
MILLDTDHISVLAFPGHPQQNALQARLNGASDQSLATTIVTVEDEMRGWLAFIKRFPDVHEQVPAYDRLANLFRFFERWQIVRFVQPLTNSRRFASRAFASAAWT